jgi:O-antigen ligase
VKWVGFVILLAAVSPLSAWLRRNPSQAPKAWMLLGLFPFILTIFHSVIALISDVGWPGYVKGIEFSVLDAFALALYFSLPGERQPLPFRFAMASYFLAVLLSAFLAQVPMSAFFYAWQLARVFLLYAVVVRGCADPRVAPAILKGMAAGLIMEAGFAIWDRFGAGALQAAGTFGHQNLLGLISHFVVFPWFALVLAGQERLPAFVVLAGAIVEVLTTSRATVGLAGLGYATLYMLSALRQWTSRKAMVLLIGAVALSILAPLALSSFGERFKSIESGETDYDERAAFEKAAAMMLADHPFGVGPNNYVMVANISGYNRAAGVALIEGSDSANVHNVYRLVAAESGYLGLFTFVLFLFRPLMVALLCGWRNRGDRRGDLLLGLGVALLIVYIHCLYEWIFVTLEAQYIFALDVGLIAGLAMQLGYWRRPHSQRVRAEAGMISIRPGMKTRGLSRNVFKADI